MVVDINKVNEVLDFRARKYELNESSAYELKCLLNAIPDEKLIDVVVCSNNGEKLNDVMFSLIGTNYQKVIVF